MSELKPCPFCQVPNKYEDTSNNTVCAPHQSLVREIEAACLERVAFKLQKYNISDLACTPRVWANQMREEADRIRSGEND